MTMREKTVKYIIGRSMAREKEIQLCPSDPPLNVLCPQHSSVYDIRSCPFTASVICLRSWIKHKDRDTDIGTNVSWNIPAKCLQIYHKTQEKCTIGLHMVICSFCSLQNVKGVAQKDQQWVLRFLLVLFLEAIYFEEQLRALLCTHVIFTWIKKRHHRCK